ncbi:MAG: monofunctional biosynthetic peptidoglycan transglycosylase [Acinetobacter sp.]|nr:monofunctional biosynthetic peptidoglycan transglycosylase [Acinetobacter sp.]
MNKLNIKTIATRAVLLIIAIFLAIQVWIFASLLWWKYRPVETTMFMRWSYYSDTSQPIRHKWVDLNDMSPYIVQAILASEDTGFDQHNGFEWASMQRALQANEQAGDVVRGGSTISQQLAKNLFLTNHRSYLRKGQEAIATVMMESLWSKQRILEVYLNSVEFGNHLFGVEEAAQRYFGHSAKQLTKEQAAFLAAILPQPRYFENDPNHSRVKARRRVILERMSQMRMPQN